MPRKKGPRIEKSCLRCKKKFLITPMMHKRYCSKECSNKEMGIRVANWQIEQFAKGKSYYRKKLPKVKLICKVCKKSFFVSNCMRKKRQYCSNSCHAQVSIVQWMKNPENKDEILERNSVAGKLGYKTLEEWHRKNPEKAFKQRSRCGKKAIKTRKDRGTYYQEMVAAGKAGSRADKVKAGKRCVELHRASMLENSKKYGYRGGKIYEYDGNKFRCKEEIKIYKMLKDAGYAPNANVGVNGKEIDFILPKKKVAIEYHPYNPHHDKRTTEQYRKDRQKILSKSRYKNFALLVFTKIGQVKFWITEQGDLNGC